MDAIDWSQERFDEIVKKLSAFLKSSGYKESDVTFVPVSGWTGENLISSTNTPLPWYTKDPNASSTVTNGIIRGATLMDLIDRLKPPERPISKPFRLCITDVFRATGIGASTVSIAGRVECGGIEINERVLLRPSNDQVTIKSILIENSNVPSAFAGDNVILNIQGVDSTHLFVGNVVCDPEYPIPCTTTIEARIIIFNISTPLLPGTPVVFHFKSTQEQCKISRLIEELDRSTGELKRRNPRMLAKNTSGVVELVLHRPICSLILTIFWLLKVSGLFTSIRIKIAQPSFEHLTIVYKFQKGDYSVSAETFKDIMNYSPAHSTIGIYYDNIDDTPVEERRSMVGVIVDETKDEEMIERMKADDYKAFKLPKAVQSVYTTFPFTSVFSVSIANMRVPSRLKDFIQTNKLNARPYIEVYEPTLIHYIAPLSNYEDYNVPEMNSLPEQ
ncbi:unnamed protein product [Adineta ricciae]|uniref:Uncharacterized protein n=1 Tax=Adineta ricciae TaxID=249248 RepID=A0A815APJ8_ADIRI|nr:unnamed protein product [Adineta ricciae]